MSIIRNRTARDRRKARQYRLERLAERMATLQPLIAANPYDGRYPGGGNGGSKGDHSDPTYLGVINPDRIEGRLEAADRLIDRALEALEDATTHLRAVETHDTQTERVNTVTVCAICVGPCVPKPRNHEGQGPLCPACYSSAYAATTSGIAVIVWRSRRMQFLAESA